MIPIKLDESSKKHYYLQIQERIRGAIDRGELAPHTKLPSIKEWAPIIGVNLHTINRALNNLTKEGILYRRRKIGTFVGQRRDRGKDDKEQPARFKILVLFPDEKKLNYFPYTQEVLRGIVSQGSHYDFEVVIECFDAAKGFPRKEFLRRKNIKGILIDKEGFLNKNVIRIIEEYEGNVVFFNSTLVTHRGTPSVVIDNAKGSFLATEHLIGNGHQRIAIILRSKLISSSGQGSDLDYVSDNLKLLGYKIALQKHDLAPSLEYQQPGVYADVKKIRQAVEVLLGLRPAPTAILSADDLIAFEVLKALNEKGVRVPDDISLVGFNNLLYSQISQPGLTTVNAPLFEMGQKAVDLLFAGYENKHLVLDVKLMERDSVRPVGISGAVEPAHLSEHILSVT